MQDDTAIVAKGIKVELVEDFCYLGANMSAARYQTLLCQIVNIMEQQEHQSVSKSQVVYKSLVISTLLYGAELRPLPVTQMKKF